VEDRSPTLRQAGDPSPAATPPEHWLNRERFTVYPRIVLALFVAIGAGWIAVSHNLVDPTGKPLGYDFIAYWSASHLALLGQPQEAYKVHALLRSHQAAVPGTMALFPWYYPPTFYLVVLPLALMPYLAAYFAFVGSTFSAHFAAFRRVASGREAMVCLIAFPGVWINFAHGQNGYLTATLAAGALLCLQRHPLRSGLLVGLLAIKPHLAVLFPVALIAARAWRALGAAGLTAAALLLAGTAVLGKPTLSAFFDSLWMPRWIVEAAGDGLWIKMPTAIAMARMLGVPTVAAALLHAAVACGAVWVVWSVWRQCRSVRLRGAALMVGTFLVTPYAFDYDLAWLAFPIAWLALEGLEKGWLSGERELLVAAWFLPLLMIVIGKMISIQVAPALLGALLWAIARRARLWRPSALSSPASPDTARGEAPVSDLTRSRN
jgi:hypothetical protein